MADCDIHCKCDSNMRERCARVCGARGTRIAPVTVTSPTKNQIDVCTHSGRQRHLVKHRLVPLAKVRRRRSPGNECSRSAGHRRVQVAAEDATKHQRFLEQHARGEIPTDSE